MKQKPKQQNQESEARRFLNGVVQGAGWALGVTVGFAFVSTVIVILLRRAGGIPVVGNFLATIVQATMAQLSSRTPTFIH